MFKRALPVMALCLISASGCATMNTLDSGWAMGRFSAAVKEFAGKAVFQDALVFGRHDKKVQPPKPLAGRIMDGFQELPMRRLVLKNTGIVFWGFEYQDASIQSLVIVNRNDHVKLVAAVTLFPSVGTGVLSGSQDIDYKTRTLKSGQISVFVRNWADLARYLPVIKSWAYANLLGFNVDCYQSAEWERACRAATGFRLPLRAYDLRDAVMGKKKLVNLYPLSIPKGVAPSVPLGAFRQ